MNPQPLLSPFIGISMYQEDYSKVQGLLPTPSYTDILHSYNIQKIILIYAIEGYIVTHNQYRWISNIKLGLEVYLCVGFKYVEDYHITDETNITNCIYTIDELSKAFKAPLIDYPKIMYPATKKELYRCLCWYGKRLIHQERFTKEVMTATALLMNSHFKDNYNTKELHKKALGAYMFIDENRERFNIRLDEVALKEAYSKGGIIRKTQRVQNTKERIDQLLKDDKYIKPNGKINLTSLAKDVGLTRKTVAKYI